MIRILVLLACLTAVAPAQVPVFADPVPIEANGTPINVGTGGNASPFVIDWDGDGRQDLLLGQYWLGRVRFYANVGTNFDPLFGDFSYLEADGSPLTVSYG